MIGLKKMPCKVYQVNGNNAYYTLLCLTQQFLEIGFELMNNVQSTSLLNLNLVNPSNVLIMKQLYAMTLDLLTLCSRQHTPPSILSNVLANLHLNPSTTIDEMTNKIEQRIDEIYAEIGSFIFNHMFLQSACCEGENIIDRIGRQLYGKSNFCNTLIAKLTILYENVLKNKQIIKMYTGVLNASTLFKIKQILNELNKTYENAVKIINQFHSFSKSSKPISFFSPSFQQSPSQQSPPQQPQSKNPLSYFQSLFTSPWIAQPQAMRNSRRKSSKKIQLPKPNTRQKNKRFVQSFSKDGDYGGNRRYRIPSLTLKRRNTT